MPPLRTLQLRLSAGRPFVAACLSLSLGIDAGLATAEEQPPRPVVKPTTIQLPAPQPGAVLVLNGIESAASPEQRTATITVQGKPDGDDQTITIVAHAIDGQAKTETPTKLQAKQIQLRVEVDEQEGGPQTQTRRRVIEQRLESSDRRPGPPNRQLNDADRQRDANPPRDEPQRDRPAPNQAGPQDRGPQDRGPQDRGPQDRGPQSRGTPGRGPDFSPPGNQRGPGNRDGDDAGRPFDGRGRGPAGPMGAEPDGYRGPMGAGPGGPRGPFGFGPGRPSSPPQAIHELDQLLDSPVIRKLLELKEENMELHAERRIAEVEMQAKLELSEMRLQHAHEQLERAMLQVNESREQAQREMREAEERREQAEHQLREAHEMREQAERQQREAHEVREDVGRHAEELEGDAHRLREENAAMERIIGELKEQLQGEQRRRTELEAGSQEAKRLILAIKGELEAAEKSRLAQQEKALLMQRKLEELQKDFKLKLSAAKEQADGSKKERGEK